MILKIFIRSVSGLIVAMLLLAIGAALGLHFYMDLKLYPKLSANQENFQQYEKFILADFKVLEKEPIFKKIDFKKDAAPYLQTFIPLDGLNLKPELSSQNQIIERLFKQFPDWLNDKVDFKGLTSDSSFAELDPKWLEQLKTFDYWNWTTQPEIQRRIQLAHQQNGIDRMGTLASLPIPNYTLLRNWAAVYTIQKLQTKDLQTGLKIFRKVAELINSTATLTGQMQAVAMLKAEHKMMNDFQARDWQLVPLSSIDAYKRLSWAWVHLARQPFYSEMKPEYAKFATSTFGACAGATENMINLFGIRDFLEPQVFFEKSFSQNYIRAEHFQENLLSTCHLDDLSHLIEYSSTAKTSWMTEYNVLSMASASNLIRNPSVWSFWQRINWSRVPFARKFIGLNIFLQATPDTLPLYRDLANEKVKN